MPKKREKSQREFWKAQQREAHRWIKEIEQRLAELDREPRTKPKKVKAKVCNSCGKGKLVLFELMGREYLTCDLCGDRTKTK